MFCVFSGTVKSAPTRAERFGVVLMWIAVAVMLMTGAFINNFRLFVVFIFFVVAVTGKRWVNDQRVALVYRSPKNLLQDN
jgi:hypothetical protein